MPQEQLISDDHNCHDTPLILTRPSNCSTILLRIIVCLHNGLRYFAHEIAKSRNSEISNYNSCFKTFNKLVWFLGYGKMLVVRVAKVATALVEQSLRIV